MALPSIPQESRGLITPPITPKAMPTKRRARARNELISGQPSPSPSPVVPSGDPSSPDDNGRRIRVRPPRAGTHRPVETDEERVKVSEQNRNLGARPSLRRSSELHTSEVFRLAKHLHSGVKKKPFDQAKRARRSPRTTDDELPVSLISEETPPPGAPHVYTDREIPNLSRASSPAVVDQRIQQCLSKPLSTAQRDFAGVGNNYVFAVVPDDHPGGSIVKIGVTKGAGHVRLAGIARHCRHLAMEEQSDPEHAPIRLYRRAELLAHKELEGSRYRFGCGCRVAAHREYFDVEPGVALEVVCRWREFCRREPYDGGGNLRPFWRHRLDRLNSICGAPGEEPDHRRRARRWSVFANPARYEIMWFDAKETFRGLWRWRWLAVALVESFVIAILTLPRVYPVYIFAFLVVCVSAETSGMAQPLFPLAIGWASTITRAEFNDPQQTTPPAVYIDPFGEGRDENLAHGDADERLETPG